MKDLEKDLVLGNLVRAVELLESSRSFSSLIPEIRSNLVFALPDAKTIKEVAGIEGRITVVGGKPKAPGYPRFGASSHLARSVLEIMKVNSSKRAAIVMKYDDDIERAVRTYCKENKLLVTLVNREREPQEIATREGESMGWIVRRAIELLGDAPDFLFSTGGAGKEPTTKIFGSTAVEVARRAIEISGRIQ